MIHPTPKKMTAAMTKSDRRAKRLTSDLVIELLLRVGMTGPTTAGPVPAFLSNISRYGAGLIVSRSQWDDNHSFTLANDHPRHLLFLAINQPPAPILSIPAKLVWFKYEALEESGYYQLGLEFIAHPDDESVQQFYAKACQGVPGRQGFWSRLFSPLPG